MTDSRMLQKIWQNDRKRDAIPQEKDPMLLHVFPL